jgi:hypothetical protein
MSVGSAGRQLYIAHCFVPPAASIQSLLCLYVKATFMLPCPCHVHLCARQPALKSRCTSNPAARHTLHNTPHAVESVEGELLPHSRSTYCNACLWPATQHLTLTPLTHIVAPASFHHLIPTQVCQWKESCCHTREAPTARAACGRPLSTLH